MRYLLLKQYGSSEDSSNELIFWFILTELQAITTLHFLHSGVFLDKKT